MTVVQPQDERPAIRKVNHHSLHLSIAGAQPDALPHHTRIALPSTHNFVLASLLIKKITILERPHHRAKQRQTGHNPVRFDEERCGGLALYPAKRRCPLVHIQTDPDDDARLASVVFVNSVKIPQTFFPFSKTSFGHLTSGKSPK